MQSLTHHPCWPLLMAAQGDALTTRLTAWLHDTAGCATIEHSSAYKQKQITFLNSNEACLGVDISVEAQYSLSMTCFCMGVLSTTDVSTLDHCTINSCCLDYTHALMMSVIKLLKLAKLSLLALQSVKIFVPAVLFDIDSASLNDKIVNHCQLLIGKPVTILSTQADNSCISVVFIAIDLLQIKTEMWIRGD